MNVIIVKSICAGTQHGRETVASGGAHLLAEGPRHLTVNKTECGAVAQRNRTDIKRVAFAVLRRLSA